MEPVQDRVQWQASVLAVLKLRVLPPEDVTYVQLRKMSKEFVVTYLKLLSHAWTDVSIQPVP